MHRHEYMNIYEHTHSALKNIIFAVLNFKRYCRATLIIIFFLVAGWSSDFSAPLFACFVFFFISV